MTISESAPRASPYRSMPQPRAFILVAAFFALAVKLCIAALTVGTNDAESFYNFGRFIWEHGLLSQYRVAPEFNHTPMTGWFCAAAYGIGQGLGFNWFLRAPGIVSDFISVLVLLRWREMAGRPPSWALALFALSPVSVMVSGYHGNVDSVLTCLLLLAVRDCDRGRAISCGVWLGLACNVKVIPLLAAPVFFFFWFSRGRARAFFLPAAACILAGWAVPLIALPRVFLSQVLGYSSNWGSWGIPYALRASGLPLFEPLGFMGLTPGQAMVMALLKCGIIALALWVAWHRRAMPTSAVFSTMAFVWAGFFVLAPGVGAQYLVWIAPFLLVDSAFWYAAVTLASGIFLGVFYQTISGGWPWYRGISTAELVPAWVAWSLLPWGALAAFLFARRSEVFASALTAPQGRQTAEIPEGAEIQDLR
jgi:Glycosyltransferase family 87